MPRVVDAGARKGEIADAALALARRSGLSAVTFRNIAKEMGARSTTVVSHYAPSRKALVELMFDRLAELDSAAQRPAGTASAADRLFELGERLLPLTSESRLLAQLRVEAALAFSNDEAGEGMLAGWGLVARSDLEAAVRELQPAVGVGAATDTVVAGINGIVLQGLVDPGSWTAPRQRLALRTLLRSLGLTAPIAGPTFA